jgi:hypothetical protein
MSPLVLWLLLYCNYSKAFISAEIHSLQGSAGSLPATSSHVQSGLPNKNIYSAQCLLAATRNKKTMAMLAAYYEVSPGNAVDKARSCHK